MDRRLNYLNTDTLLVPVLGRNGEFLASVCATGCENPASVGGAHTLTESVLVDALAV